MSDTIALIVLVVAPFGVWFALRRTTWYKTWFVGTADDPAVASQLLVLGVQSVLILVAIAVVGLVVLAIVLWAWRTVFGPTG